MRLLHVRTLQLEEFHFEKPPNYVIASHRWAGDETTFAELEKKEKDRRETRTSGYQKVVGFAEFIKRYIPHVEWLWIDTCCINRIDNSELTEAIISMYKWYREAEVCLAYLADVEPNDMKDTKDTKDADGANDAKDPDDSLSEFKRSEWFRRGWTLQELLAPRTVIFLTKTWQVIGYKGSTGRGTSSININSGPSLTAAVVAASRVPRSVLDDFEKIRDFSVHERLAWMAGRTTTREEDATYSLLGIFNVSMPVLYGEGGKQARDRLLAEVYNSLPRQQQPDESRKITDWLSAPDPWTSHTLAQQKYEAQTGLWLLGSERYQRWKDGSSGHLWLSGKPGCGKTILCSSVVEDMQQYCENNIANIGFAIFYFSFSDDRKQSFENLLRSLVAQLAWAVEPALSKLCQAYQRPNASVPGSYELEEILLLAAQSYRTVFIILDALDECPESDTGDTLQGVLRFLERLSESALNIKIFATSRELPSISHSMDIIGASRISITEQQVDRDIYKYVSSQISYDAKLCKLNTDMKTLVVERLSQKANGMFRWAFCQLMELRKLKSIKPTIVKAALDNLPSSLDETYERMLVGIEEKYYDKALVLLKWLAYAQSPPSLGELVEATVINVENRIVETDNRGSLEDTLEILSGLVTIIESDRNETMDSDEDEYNGGHTRKQVTKETKITLAHFSVKDFLESKRISQSKSKRFYLDEAAAHGFLAQSCLIYLIYCSESVQKKATREDLTTFPLLRYAAQTWFYHSSLQQARNVSLEIALLCSESARYYWLLVHQPDRSGVRPLQERLQDSASALYYACVTGLEAVVRELLNTGYDVDAKGGAYSNALQAASRGGHGDIVKMLLDAGANVNAEGGYYGNALQAASRDGHEKVAMMLLDAGANVNAEGGYYGNALQAASRGGHEKVVTILLDAGANVNAEGGYYGNALQAASRGGHEKVVTILLDAGANVNAQGGHYDNALQAALVEGNTNIAWLLREHSANWQDTESISSITSIKSQQRSSWSAEESLSSVSSAYVEFDGPVDLFVETLLIDETLFTLLNEAVQKMSSDRFVRNHRRLLKEFYSLLHPIARTELEQKAVSLLRSRATRIAISRSIYGSLLSPGTFQKLKTKAESQPQVDLVERMLQPSQNAVDTAGNASTEDKGEELHPNKNPDSNSSEASSRSASESEGSQSEEADRAEDKQSLTEKSGLEIARTFLFSGSAFECYKRDVRRFVQPPSSRLLKKLIAEGNLIRVQELLDQDFEAIVADEFSWLNELVEIGCSCKEIAELLVDSEANNPWIFLDLGDTPKYFLDPELHQRDCIHHAFNTLAECDEAVQGLPRLEMQSNADSQLHCHVKRLLDELCGFAGVVPESRKPANWDGQVEFQHQDSNVTSSVSYSGDSSLLYYSRPLRERIVRISERLHHAFGLLQRYGVCCNSFTILRWAKPDSKIPLVELCRIEASSILRFFEALRNIDGSPDGVQKLLEHAHSLICKVIDVEPRQQYPDFTNDKLLLEHALHESSLAIQMIGLALLSYGQAHAGQICPLFLAQPVHTVVLQGSHSQHSKLPLIIAEPVRLTCIGNMIRNEVIVFRSNDDPSLPNYPQAFDVLGAPEDVIDTWGPALIITNRTLLQDGQVVGIEIGGGMLATAISSPPCSQRLHWEASTLARIGLQAQAFSLRRKVIIGTVHENNTCQLLLPGKEYESRQSCHGLDILGTRGSSWHHNTIQIGLQAGQYVIPGVSFGYEKREGITAKEKMMQKLKSICPKLSISDLEAHYGLQISLCTGVARRVPLRLLMSDVLINYVENNLPYPRGWLEFRDELINALQGPKFESWLSGIQPFDKQQIIINTLADLLRHLEFTGLEQSSLLNIAWIRPGEEQLRLQLECNDCNLWARILEDTELCATFACITTRCLVEEGHPCRGSQVGKWQHVSKLLATEICLAATSKPVTQAHGSFVLQDKTRYWIGPVKSGLVASAKVQGRPKEPALEISRLTGLVPEKICNRLLKMQNVARERVRERGAVGGHTVSVSVYTRHE